MKRIYRILFALIAVAFSLPVTAQKYVIDVVGKNGDVVFSAPADDMESFQFTNDDSQGRILTVFGDGKPIFQAPIAGTDYMQARLAEEREIPYAIDFMLDDSAANMIDENTGIISVRVPFGTDLTFVRPNFAVKDGITVKVDGEEQTSGKDIRDFSMPVTYTTLDKDSVEKTFVVAICYSDLPVVYINTAGGTSITSKMEYLKTDVYVTNSQYDGIYRKANIKGRGNSSWTNFDKKPYTLKLDKKAEFMGMAKHKTFAFVANHSDKTLLRNSFAYQMGNEIYNKMSWNPHTRNVHLVVNGEYRGLYMVTETAKIDSKRVNVPNIEDCQSLEDAPNYGFLMEVNARLDEYFNFKSTKGVCFSLKEPDGEDISEELREYIQAKVQSVEDALYSPDFYKLTSKNYYGKHIDVNSFIDWYLVNEITKNNDAIFYSSCFMYFDPADKKMHMGPLWDFDISCGNINYGDCDNYEGFKIKKAAWISQLFKDKGFLTKLKSRWNKKKDELVDFVANQIPAQCSALSVDADYNFQKWPILGTYVWPNADGYEERTTYQSEVDFLTTWLLKRIDWLDKNINNL